MRDSSFNSQQAPGLQKTSRPYRPPQQASFFTNASVETSTDSGSNHCNSEDLQKRFERFNLANVDGPHNGARNSRGRGMFYNQRRNIGAYSGDSSYKQGTGKDWYSVGPRSEDYESKFKTESTQSGINFDKYDDIPVEIQNNRNNVQPIEDIDQLPVSEIFRDNLRLMGFQKLTPIQKYSVPCLASDNDVLASAQTGSGKTVAFLLPIINKIFNEGHYNSVSYPMGSRNCLIMPKALVIAPTRELACQINEVCEQLCYRTQIKTSVVYGGVPILGQYRGIQTGCHILIGTPGRLNDMKTRRMVSLEMVKNVVLDEADRMLDMGFEPQIRQIFTGGVPEKSERLNCMFSATFPPEVRHLANNYLNDALSITVGKVGVPTENVKQNFLVANTHIDRMEKLIKLLSEPDHRTLVFCEQKRKANELELDLHNNGLKAVAIHGDRDQSERNLALRLFKNGKVNIMVATSVASRGLDIPNITRVINFEMPSNIDEYVHRIGRTGRAGNTGEAFSFLSFDNSGLIRDLKNLFRESKQPIPDILNNFGSGHHDSHASYDDYSRSFLTKNKSGGFGDSNRGNDRSRGRPYRANQSNDFRRSEPNGFRHSKDHFSGSNKFSSNYGRNQLDNDDW